MTEIPGGSAWHPIVAGVDASPEGGLAAAMAWRIARSVDADLYVIHVAGGAPRIAGERPEGEAEWEGRRADAVCSVLRESLAGNVPPDVLDRVQVRFGNPAQVLRRVTEEVGAGLLVLGGKRHAPPVRWFGGSTVHNVVRTVDTPLLVAASVPDPFGRILVAVDLSDAAAPTLETAMRFAGAFRGQVRVLHVVEPLPSVPDLGVQLDEGEHLASAENGFRRLVAACRGTEHVETVVRHGTAARTIAEEAEEWGADAVVVGSHGKGIVDRVLLGSTTGRLINRLPTSVLVIPMRPPGA